MDHSLKQRIMIIGQPGSGKSTLARSLGQILELPVYHIDLIHWQPGWTERPVEEKSRLCHEVHQKEQWIFEGGHSRTWPERLNRADTLIWLDIPLYVRAFRVCKRTLQHHGQSRPDLPVDCPERFDWEFTSWIWNTRHTGRANMQRLFDSAPHDKTKFRVQNSAQVRELLKTLEAQHNTSISYQGNRA